MALGTDGKPTTDANEAFYNGKGLMPLGGEEINSGYKGYGLGMLVDILCGIMSGSNNGPNIRHWNNYVGEVANLGHFFVAIDPDYFAPDFQDRLQVNFLLIFENPLGQKRAGPKDQDNPFILCKTRSRLKCVFEIILGLGT